MSQLYYRLLSDSVPLDVLEDHLNTLADEGYRITAILPGYADTELMEGEPATIIMALTGVPKHLDQGIYEDHLTSSAYGSDENTATN